MLIRLEAYDGIIGNHKFHSSPQSRRALDNALSYG